MAQGRSRPAWAEIDLAAVAHNAAVLPACRAGRAVRGGQGARLRPRWPAVARAALAGGAGRLAVALVDEGVELREHGVTAPVLLLSECDPAAAATALSFGLTPTLYSAEGIAALSSRGRAGRPVAVHVKVDTGMHRVGARPRTCTPLRRPWWPSLFELEGIWTHLAVADGETEDRAYTEGQLALFDHLVAELAAAGITAPLLHAANTAGAIAFPGAARHGALRARPLRLPARSARSRAFDAQAGGEQLRPACRSRRGWWRCDARRGGAPLLRPPASAADALARGHGPDRLRRRRAPAPLRRWRRGADRRRAPAAGRGGDDGPAGGRLW